MCSIRSLQWVAINTAQTLGDVVFHQVKMYFYVRYNTKVYFHLHFQYYYITCILFTTLMGWLGFPWRRNTKGSPQGMILQPYTPYCRVLFIVIIYQPKLPLRDACLGGLMIINLAMRLMDIFLLSSVVTNLPAVCGSECGCLRSLSSCICMHGVTSVMIRADCACVVVSTGHLWLVFKKMFQCSSYVAIRHALSSWVVRGKRGWLCMSGATTQKNFFPLTSKLAVCLSAVSIYS